MNISPQHGPSIPNLLATAFHDTIGQAALQNLPQEVPETRVLEEVRDTGQVRRQIMAELAGIKELLRSYPLYDEITENIRLWHREFRRFMHVENFEPVLNMFVDRLQDILRDPIYQEPLDEKARLGSDGKTYGRKSLAVFLSLPPENIRQHFPLGIITVPHPIVKELVKWLARHGSLLPYSDEIENRYRDLKARGRLAVIPTMETERLKEIRERELQRQRENQEEVNRQIAPLRILREEHILRQFGPLIAQIGINHQNHLEQIAEVQRRIGLPAEALFQELLMIRNRNEEALRPRLIVPENEMEEFAEAVALHRERTAARRREVEAQLEVFDEEIERERDRAGAEMQRRIVGPENEHAAHAEAMVEAIRHDEEERRHAREAQVAAFGQELVQIEADIVPIQQDLEAAQRQAQEDHQNNLERLGNLQILDQQRERELRRDIGELSIQVRHAEEQNAQLNSMADQLDRKIAEGEKANADLHTANMKLKKAINARNKGWTTALLVTAAVVAGCGVATLGIQAATALQGTVSAGNGVLKVGIAIAL